MIADVDRVMESLAPHSVAAQHLDLLLAELQRRRRRGFGLVWDAESPDNAERLRVPVKDLNDPRSCGLALEDGVVVDHVDSATDLYRLERTFELNGEVEFVLQPWEPRTGGLPVEPRHVPRSEISHVVHLPYDQTTAVYPVLAHRESIAHPDCPDGVPRHTIIEGENYHALQALLAAHRGKIDLIYIDPPYNTGNQDFAYNDRYVSAEDDFRHSSWLRFMERRLRLAKQLLSDTGVLIVAIGDDEHHQLRLLLDQTFGAANFISDVVWNGGRKNGSRLVSNGADYMLIFAADIQALTSSDVRWRERKVGLEAALAKAAEVWERHGANAEVANIEWKLWLKTQKSSGASTDAVNRYDQLHPRTGRPISTYQDLSWPKPGGPRYDVLHPTTSRPVKQPSTGWRFSDPARMQAEIDAGRVWFGTDETVIPRRITYLDETDTQVPLSVFEQDRKAANTRMREMLGDIPFANPKDVNVIARWISITAGTNATILDFFAGSGTTLHAVAQLNADDGGTRQCILVANNTSNQGRTFVPDGGPNGICQKVTIPRVRAALETGYAKVDPILQRTGGPWRADGSFPELSAVYRKVGVNMVDGKPTLDESAPIAPLRRAIFTQPRP